MHSIDISCNRWNITFKDVSNISDLRARNLDKSTWVKTLTDSRAAYIALKNHFLRNIDHPDDVTTDPLTDDQSSPWNLMRQDEDLRAEIFQDVERCMPENLYFREPDVQALLLDVLFVFCKLNPDVGYRQGMHEILAPLVWVISRDALQSENSDSNAALDVADAQERELLLLCLDPRVVEQDSFTLFTVVMQTVKSYYENNTSSGTPSSSIAARSQRIHEDLLGQADPELAKHLTAIEIIPQIFLIRWIRLLFGREFELDSVLMMWDALFAEDPTLGLVDLICVAMLLRIRWQLVAADYSTALNLLIRYPFSAVDSDPSSFVFDALLLRSNLSSSTGSEIITKHTGRSPTQGGSQDKKSASKDGNRLRAVSQSLVPRSLSPNLSPAKFLQEQGGIEAIMRGAAKGAYARSEQWGVNKAVRGAIQNLQVTGISPSKATEGSRWSLDAGRDVGAEITNVTAQMKSMQNRNMLLANLMGKAMDDLWVHQKQEQNDTEKVDSSIDRLSLATAKLQFIQVYLENPSMPLTAEDEADPSRTKASGTSSEEQETPSDAKAIEEALPPDSPTHKPVHRPAPPHASSSTSKPNPDLTISSPTASPSKPSTPPPHPLPSRSHLPRPSITQSSFSWILDTTTDTTNTLPAANKSNPSNDTSDSKSKLPFTASPPSSAQKRNARERAAYLFGDIPTNTEEGSKRSESAGPKEKRQGKAEDDVDEGIGLGEMESRREGRNHG